MCNWKVELFPNLSSIRYLRKYQWVYNSLIGREEDYPPSMKRNGENALLWTIER